MKRMEVESIALDKGMPKKMLPMLEIPDGLEKEEKGSAVYFVKRSGKETEDPYISLTGGKENLGWADYLLGFVEYHGTLHVVMIDKGRKIAIETQVANSMDNAVEWENLERSISISLKALDDPSVDHVEFTFNHAERIFNGDERSWQ